MIHNKAKCVWGCKTELPRHPELKLLLIMYHQAWEAYKSHMVALEDQAMRNRINCLIDFAGNVPYALEIRYHRKCWLKCVCCYQKLSEDDKLPYMQTVTLHEAQTMFFDHIRKVIFEQLELRSLQSLLHDYRSTISLYGFLTSVVKSLYIKDILTQKFKGTISFHSFPQRNLSELVYDMSVGGYYVEAAFSSLGVSSGQLVCNVAEWLRDDIKSVKLIEWLLRVEELEEEEELQPLIVKLLSALWAKKVEDLCPSTLSLTSLITHVTKQPTTAAINATITLHGMTSNKELVTGRV